MNWQSWQLDRARSLQRYQGIFWTSIRFLALVIGSLAVLTLLLATFLSLPTSLIPLSLVLLGPALAVVSFDLFIHYLVQHPEFLLTDELRQANLLNNFDFASLDIISSWQKDQTWQAFWRQAMTNSEVAIIFYRLGLDGQSLEQYLSNSTMSDQDMVNFLDLARQKSQQLGQSLVTIYSLAGLAISQPIIGKIASSLKLKEEELTGLVDFYSQLASLRHQRDRLDPLQAVERSGGFARGWAVSYTNFLDSFTQTITPELGNQINFTPLFGREELIGELVTELNKSVGQNVLLVGETGVGKRDLFFHLAARVVTLKTGSHLDGMEARILDTERLVTIAKSSGQLEEIFQKIFTDMSRAGNILLFIDNIDLLLGADSQAGQTNVSSLLQTYLEDPSIKIVASITKEEHLTLIKPNQALNRQLTAVEIMPPSVKDTESILLYHLPTIEKRYNTFFILSAIQAIVDYGHRYLKDQASPQREIDLAEEVAAWAQSRSLRVVGEQQVVEVVQNKAHVPIQVKSDERQSLLKLDEELHKRIVGQDRAIKLIADSLLRARAGLSNEARPIGSFLFLGPTGVGKTETAKALAAIYFGSEAKMIRLDMTEFADSNGLAKLLGSDPVHQPGSLTVKIQENPSTVLLLDEIEKASDQVKNVFLQLIDEGRLTTNYGKVLDFTNVIIIATSNAGSEMIKDQISKQVPISDFEKQLIDSLIKQRIFLTEFLNRFDGVVVYLPLSLPEIKKVVELRLAKLKALIKAEKGVDLEIAPAVVKQLAEKGYDPVFGARALDRVVKEQLETAIARELVAKNPAAGSKLSIESI